MKKRKFGDGGDVPPGGRFDSDTYARANKYVADNASPSKPRVVSKKELADSGLSLRDFLNKERGLTRKKDPDPTAGEGKDPDGKDANAQFKADAMDTISSPTKPKMFGGMFNKDKQFDRDLTAKIAKKQASDAEDKSTLDRENARASRAKPPSDSDTPVSKSKVLSMKGVNPQTMMPDSDFKRGGGVKKYAKGGSVDGLAQRGKTRGTMR